MKPVLRSPADTVRYLHRHIPVSAAMGVEVLANTPEGTVLRAPLAPNLNHRATVFGGSASAVAILAAWTWLHFVLRDADLACRVVIQRNQMDYLAPITGDFTAHCAGVAEAELEKLLRTLRRHGKGRVTVTARLEQDGNQVARFAGDYVAVVLA
jgi:thioesterase domain-containing protein